MNSQLTCESAVENSFFSASKRACFPSESAWLGFCYHCNGTEDVKKDDAMMLKFKSMMPQCSLCRAKGVMPKVKWLVPNAAAAVVSNLRKTVSKEAQTDLYAQQKEDGAPPEYEVEATLEIAAIVGYRKFDPTPTRDRGVEQLGPRRKFVQWVGWTKKQCSRVGGGQWR